MIKALVIAGSKFQYDNWLKETMLDGQFFKYVSSPEDYYCHSRVPIIKVGTYWENKCYKELKNIMDRSRYESN